MKKETYNELQKLLGMNVTQTTALRLQELMLEDFLDKKEESSEDYPKAVDVNGQFEKAAKEINKTRKPVDNFYGYYNVAGLGPDAPLADDGLQSKADYRFDLLPPLALAKVAAVLDHGAKKYGANSWLRLDDPRTHINHALGHCVAFLAGDTQEEGEPCNHLVHSLCRLLFAVELIEREKQDDFRYVSGTIGTNFDERV